jgi:predicted NBD/HSP70 family sugar kinase
VEERLILEANKIKEITNVKQIFNAVNNKEDWAINILDHVIMYICIAINNMVCMYNPDTLILSGSLIEGHPEIVEYIEEKCGVLIWEPLRNTFKIVYSQLKNKADIVGAATLALNTYFNLD